uniref:Uncharacterized protein n=1 Tax=Meleagris gallopavo TaxID=9103 RepID=A0A803XRS9_MELGA
MRSWALMLTHRRCSGTGAAAAAPARLLPSWANPRAWSHRRPPGALRGIPSPTHCTSGPRRRRRWGAPPSRRSLVGCPPQCLPIPRSTAAAQVQRHQPLLKLAAPGWSGWGFLPHRPRPLRPRPGWGRGPSRAAAAREGAGPSRRPRPLLRQGPQTGAASCPPRSPSGGSEPIPATRRTPGPGRGEEAPEGRAGPRDGRSRTGINFYRRETLGSLVNGIKTTAPRRITQPGASHARNGRSRFSRPFNGFPQALPAPPGAPPPLWRPPPPGIGSTAIAATARKAPASPSPAAGTSCARPAWVQLEETLFLKSPAAIARQRLAHISQAWRFQQAQVDLLLASHRDTARRAEAALRDTRRALDSKQREAETLRRENGELRRHLREAEVSPTWRSSRSSTPRPIGITSPATTVTPQPRRQLSGQVVR